VILISRHSEQVASVGGLLIAYPPEPRFNDTCPPSSAAAMLMAIKRRG
jgi:hypothetical protein